jgi:hypothetical protein
MTMPVEIKELVIRAVVQEQAGQTGGQGAAAPGGAEGGGTTPEEREAIVALAVREVLRILKASKER